MQKIIFLTILIFIISCQNDEDSIPETPDQTVPVVKLDATYDVSVLDGDDNLNQIYALGLKHSEWNNSNTSIDSIKLDIYLPELAPNNRPAIFLIHGGALQNGSRKQPRIVQLGNYFASRGWVAISLDYRLQGDKGTTPELWETFFENSANSDDQMAIYPANRDVKAAVRWLYANAETYSINTNYITACGNSAGALLSISLGITNEEDFKNELTEVEDQTLSSTNLNKPSKIHTIIDFWGGGGHVIAHNVVYGVDRFDVNDAPILIVHGDDDQIVPFNQAEALRDKYEMTGATYEFHQLVGAGHEAWNETVNGKNLAELAADFIVRQQNLIVE